MYLSQRKADKSLRSKGLFLWLISVVSLDARSKQARRNILIFVRGNTFISEWNFGPASSFEKQISKTYITFSTASHIVNKIYIWLDVLVYFWLWKVSHVFFCQQKDHAKLNRTTINYSHLLIKLHQPIPVKANRTAQEEQIKQRT